MPITFKALKPKTPEIEPQTLGEHLRKQRLYLQLTQREAAARLRVNPLTVLNWEKGKTKPPIESMPAILAFLGHDPVPEPKTLAERLLAKRRAMGWSIKSAARQLGVDPGTWRDWEHGGVILHCSHRNLVARLLGLNVGEVAQEMRTRWNCSHKRIPVRE